MRFMKSAFLLTAFILFWIFAAQVAEAEDIASKNTVLGVKGGLITGGEFWVEDYPYDMESDMSFSFGSYLDHKLGEKITGGLYLDAHNLAVYEESKLLLDLGLTIKAMIASKSANLTFKPGIGIGYGMLGEIEGLADGSNYFMLRAGCDVVFSSPRSLSWLGELAIIGAGAGGNDDHDMGFGPMFLIRGGLAF